MSWAFAARAGQSPRQSRKVPFHALLMAHATIPSLVRLVRHRLRGERQVMFEKMEARASEAAKAHDSRT
eukprot:14351983-Alexandrium_andersonii.AAC.1